jgi:hypothetical protein
MRVIVPPPVALHAIPEQWSQSACLNSSRASSVPVRRVIADNGGRANRGMGPVMQIEPAASIGGAHQAVVAQAMTKEEPHD